MDIKCYYFLTNYQSLPKNEAGVLWTANANTVPGSWFGSVLKTKLSVSSRVTRKSYAPTVISWQPAHWITVTDQSLTSHSYSHNEAGHLNTTPSSIITAATQNLPHAAAAGKLATTIYTTTPAFFSRVSSGLKVKKTVSTALAPGSLSYALGFSAFCSPFWLGTLLGQLREDLKSGAFSAKPNCIPFDPIND